MSHNEYVGDPRHTWTPGVMTVTSSIRHALSTFGDMGFGSNWTSTAVEVRNGDVQLKLLHRTDSEERACVIECEDPLRFEKAARRAWSAMKAELLAHHRRNRGHL